ncbi:MAG: hypothetical protein G01um101413_538 [Parcubacteria group bacterium Gr01-1014_13]|nr:MAG: hypothetical protein G01um101413_538 [Parcubacteria group bacterium Gr01-1014_13]
MQIDVEVEIEQTPPSKLYFGKILIKIEECRFSKNFTFTIDGNKEDGTRHLTIRKGLEKDSETVLNITTAAIKTGVLSTLSEKQLTMYEITFPVIQRALLNLAEEHYKPPRYILLGKKYEATAECKVTANNKSDIKRILHDLEISA